LEVGRKIKVSAAPQRSPTKKTKQWWGASAADSPPQKIMVGLALPRSPSINKNERSKVFARASTIIQKRCGGNPNEMSNALPKRVARKIPQRRDALLIWHNLKYRHEPAFSLILEMRRMRQLQALIAQPIKPATSN
jgi:hypothetical protein